MSWRKAVPRRYLTRCVLGDLRRMMNDGSSAVESGGPAHLFRHIAMPDHAHTACRGIRHTVNDNCGISKSSCSLTQLRCRALFTCLSF